MAKFALTPFDLTTAPDIRIDSELNTTSDAVFISFKLTGALSRVDLGKGIPQHSRVMNLWEKTCFELFIKNSEDHYLEFNFSPDFEWNCFHFEKKKSPPVPYKKMEMVIFDILFSNEVVHVIVELKKIMFPENFFATSMSAGITSVIKEKTGELSYWALSHKDTKPNFHQFESFKYKF
ncbi:MAG: hypothetical protein H7177_05160 [Rhizobacter sp.]|nr:hypothetical protein [Bacteriovorax sp.]